MWHARKCLPLIIILSLLLSVAGFASPAFADDGQGKSLASDRLVVQFEPGTSSSEIAKVHQRVGGKVDATIPEINAQVVTVSRYQKFFKSCLYRSYKQVCCVEPDYVAQAVDIPDDPYFDDYYQWGLFQIQAPQAWNITHSSPDIRIAILDTGIDSAHPDLGAKVVAKKNFTSSTTVEPVSNSHGTHVAGIAAAITDNGVGIAGLGYNASLMNVKVLGDDGYGYHSWIAQGIIWATDNGANVINLSLGGRSSSSILKDAVDYAWNHGVVVVAAAGNDGSTSPLYPAYYDNCIAVAATDGNDELTSWSNHGEWVDVAAPATAWSTQPHGEYGYMAGTSVASPYVAGLASLVFSVATDSNSNGWLNDEVRSRIETACDDVDIDVSYGRINAFKAVQGSSPTPPANRPPVLDPIGNRTVDEGQLLQFIITASDPDGDLLSYSASNLPEAASFTNQTFSWTPADGQAGIYENVQFEVSDGKLTDSENITITVNEAALAGQISGTVSDAESGTAITGARVSDGTISATTDSNGSYTISNVSEGTYTLTACAAGYHGASKSVGVSSGRTTIADFQLTREPSPGNNTMWVESITFAPIQCDGYVILRITAKVLAPAPLKNVKVYLNLRHGDQSCNLWTNTNILGEADFLLQRASDGNYVATVTDLTYSNYAWDKGRGVVSASYTLGSGPSTGEISGAVTDASSGKPVSGAAVAAGARSASTDSSGRYSISNVPPGTYSLTASADGYQNASQIVTVVAGKTSTADFSLSPDRVNHPPTLDPIGDKMVDEGQLLQFTISASDPDGDGLAYSARDLPDGASFENQTFTWTPGYSQAATYQVTFTVSDGRLDDSETITITVADIPVLPPDNAMWVESITFAPIQCEDGYTILRITVKVVSPTPLKNAKAYLNLKHGGQSYELWTSSNILGEADFLLWRASDGDYSAVITNLVHNEHTWDESKGVTSGSYTLG